MTEKIYHLGIKAWALYDNSGKHSELIAYKTNDAYLNIIDDVVWEQIIGGLHHANED